MDVDTPPKIPDHSVDIPQHVITYRKGDPLDLKGVPRLARLVLHLATRIKWGSLVFVLPDGRALRFRGEQDGVEGVIKINDYRFARRLLTGATTGFAESYFDGDWISPDISNLLEVTAKNSASLEELWQASPLTGWLQKFVHAMNKNTKKGAKRNISAHYDLGNSFYEAWLDRTMTYSSAKFGDDIDELSDAQVNKYRSLAEKIELKPHHTLLEIGSGWGGFAEFAAGEIGCSVTGITISEEQLAYSRERIARKGLSDKVDIQLTDYRDVNGKFDRIASIEMFEAVGLEYWKAYFSKVYECLKPGGIAGFQIITIDDARYDSYRRGSDFIQRYIFPGGMLPSPSALRETVEKAGLAWRDNVNFGLDYARTLATWRDRFQDAWPNIQTLGFDERFRLLWKYYLSYCEAGFRAGTVDVGQITLARPAKPV